MMKTNESKATVLYICIFEQGVFFKYCHEEVFKRLAFYRLLEEKMSAGHCRIDLNTSCDDSILVHNIHQIVNLTKLLE